MELLDHSRVGFEEPMLIEASCDVDSVPIPNQIPKPPKLEMLPSHILRSGAIESLMGQNDDLLARLNVSIAKNAQMEEKLHQKDLAAEGIQFKHDQMEDHLKIVRAKERLLMQRTQDTDNRFEALNEDIALHEIRYTELHGTSESRILQLKDELGKISKKLRRLTKFRKKIGPIIIQLRKQYWDHKEKSNYFEDKLKLDTNKWEKLDSETQLRLAESTEYIQTQGQNHRAELDQAQIRFEENHCFLTENYESRLEKQNASYSSQLDTLAAKNQDLETENDKLTIKNIKHDELRDQKIVLENKIIYQERDFKELKANSDESIYELQAGLGKYRNDAKFKTLECERSVAKLQQVTEKNKELATTNTQQMEQIESLQALWHHQQLEFDKAVEKKQSLQKLNQQLSTDMNANRKIISDLRSEKESTRWEFKKQIARLETELQTHKEKRHQATEMPQTFLEEPSETFPIVTTKQFPNNADAPFAPPNDDGDTNKNSYTRLDHIMAEIKSCHGMTTKKASAPKKPEVI